MNRDILLQVKIIENYVSRLLDESAKSFGISGAEARALKALENIIKKKDKAYAKDLEIHLNLKRSSICELINTMEKHDLIIRHAPDGDDLRHKEITLTERGKEISKQTRKRIKGYNDEIEALFSKEEINELKNKLDSVIDYLASKGE